MLDSQGYDYGKKKNKTKQNKTPLSAISYIYLIPNILILAMQTYRKIHVQTFEALFSFVYPVPQSNSTS